MKNYVKYVMIIIIIIMTIISFIEMKDDFVLILGIILILIIGIDPKPIDTDDAFY